MPFALSGEQFHLRFGDAEASVAEIGATLREFSVGGRSILDGFDADVLAPGGAGQVLAPWPNRLDGGRYEFEGTTATAPIDEPERDTAIHGLLRWLPFRALKATGAAVTLSCTLGPQPGYPWRIRVELDYALEHGALVVGVRVTNECSRSAPFGIGFHPYLAAARTGLDGAWLHVPATRRLVPDERGIPVGSEAVSGEPMPGPLDDLVLDDCYTGLRLDADGFWRVHFGPGGDGGDEVVLFADGHFGYVMCFTGDTLDPPRQRRALAVEPMTCPPNALVNGTDLVVLEPGETFSATWGIRSGGG